MHNELKLIAARENPATYIPSDNGKKGRAIPMEKSGQLLYKNMRTGKLMSANAPWPEGSKAFNVEEFQNLRLKNPEE